MVNVHLCMCVHVCQYFMYSFIQLHVHVQTVIIWQMSEINYGLGRNVFSDHYPNINLTKSTSL